MVSVDRGFLSVSGPGRKKKTNSKQTCDLPLPVHVLLGRNFVQHEPGRRSPDISCHNGRHDCTTSVVISLDSGARKERSQRQQPTRATSLSLQTPVGPGDTQKKGFPRSAQKTTTGEKRNFVPGTWYPLSFLGCWPGVAYCYSCMLVV